MKKDKRDQLKHLLSQVDNKVVNKSAANHVEAGRGIIRDNALAALVTSKLFRSQVVVAKKGKGAYQRKAKYSEQESYLIAA